MRLAVVVPGSSTARRSDCRQKDIRFPYALPCIVGDNAVMEVNNERGMFLEPGPYSVFVLIDDGMWVQPTYLIGTGWTEQTLGLAAVGLAGKRAFYYAGVQRDEDAPEDCIEILGDFA